MQSHLYCIYLVIVNNEQLNMLFSNGRAIVCIIGRTLDSVLRLGGATNLKVGGSMHWKVGGQYSKNTNI